MTETNVVPDAAALARWQRAVIAAFALGGITVSAWGPRLPALKAQLGVDNATIGLILAGITVGAISGLALSNPLLHRLGSRRAVTAGLLLVAAAMALLGVGVAARSVPVVTVGLICIGLGIGTVDVLVNVEGAAIQQAVGRTVMPRMHGAWSVGAAAGSGIGAGCAALGIAPAAQFIGEGAAIGLIGLLMASSIPPGSRAPAVHQSESRAARIRHYFRGWADWKLLLIGVVMLGVELGEGSANNWLTLAVHTDHGQTAAVAALFFTAFAIGEASTRIFGGPLVDRMGRVQAIRVTTALGMLGMVLFILGPDPWLVLVGVLLWSVGVSMGFPLGMSAAAESGPDPAGRVSVAASIGYFASLAGPPVIGALAQAFGLLHALWLLAALFAAAFAVAGSLRPTPAKAGSASPAGASASPAEASPAGD